MTTSSLPRFQADKRIIMITVNFLSCVNTLECKESDIPYTAETFADENTQTPLQTEEMPSKQSFFTIINAEKTCTRNFEAIRFNRCDISGIKHM